MHNTESVPENKTQKILSDLEIETVLRIPDKRPDLGIINNNHNNEK